VSSIGSRSGVVSAMAALRKSGFSSDGGVGKSMLSDGEPWNAGGAGSDESRMPLRSVIFCVEEGGSGGIGSMD